MSLDPQTSRTPETFILWNIHAAAPRCECERRRRADLGAHRNFRHATTRPLTPLRIGYMFALPTAQEGERAEVQFHYRSVLMKDVKLIELGAVSDETRESDVPIGSDNGTVEPFVYLGS
jgi:hypothetical protein